MHYRLKLCVWLQASNETIFCNTTVIFCHSNSHIELQKEL